MKQPDLWVIAGPNGAGKSTFSRRKLVGKFPIVNPDDLAAVIDLARRNTVAVQVAAGRQAIAEREGHLQAGRSFAIETPLTGRGELDLIRRARGAGYRVNLVFVGLKSASLSQTRVAQRVREGGHDVPPDAIERRFARSLANLAPALAIADRAWVFDNTGKQRQMLLARRHQQVRHVAKQLPAWAAEAIPARLRARPQSHGLGRD